MNSFKGTTLPSQSAAYARTVAALMEDYKLRILKRIALEAAKRGEDKMDIAQVAKVYPGTAERWLSFKRFPQLEQRKLIAKHYGIPIGELDPAVLADLEQETFEQRLERIEQMLVAVLAQSGLKRPEGRQRGEGLAPVEGSPLPGRNNKPTARDKAADTKPTAPKRRPA